VVIYVNACPHLGLPLDWAPGEFLSACRSHFVCAVHWAQFETATGRCFAGPCEGEQLEQVAFDLHEGMISVSYGTDV
jgi:nitrite reductase/ring-hydroxylating ferredoxin subunit